MLVFGKFSMLCVLTNNRFEIGLLNFATINWKIAWNIYTNKKCIALYYLAFNFSISSFSCDSCESNIDILCAILLPSRKLYAKISTYSLHAKISGKARNLVLIFFLLCNVYQGHVTIKRTSSVLLCVHSKTSGKIASQK